MKKGIKENKVQRMRNLATGNYNKGVHIRSGYLPVENVSSVHFWFSALTAYTV